MLIQRAISEHFSAVKKLFTDILMLFSLPLVPFSLKFLVVAAKLADISPLCFFLKVFPCGNSAFLCPVALRVELPGA